MGFERAARLALGSEKLRYLAAGAWNSLAGWLIFAALWQALHTHVGLWPIAVAAHLGATTQAFLVQRHFVFRAADQRAWPQFAKFQVSYFILLGIAGLALNAMVAQGAHPLVSQVGTMVLLALCGFVFGKHFTFVPSGFHPRAAFDAVLRTLRTHRGMLAALVASLLALAASGRLPGGSAAGVSPLAVQALEEGRQWLQANGWVGGLFNPPWWSSTWCGGGAFFADLRIAFYSPQQWAAPMLGPVRAMQAGALLVAACGFVAAYALARTVLHWRPAGAVVFAVLGLAHAFAPLHSGLGQPGAWGLALWPALAWALTRPQAPGGLPWPGIWAGLVLTVWMQAGMAPWIVPASLGVLLFCAALCAAGLAAWRNVVARAALGAAIAGVLNAGRWIEGWRLAAAQAVPLPGEVGPAGLEAAALVGSAPGRAALDFGGGALLLAFGAGAWLLLRRPAAAAPRVMPARLAARAWPAVLLGALPLLMLAQADFAGRVQATLAPYEPAPWGPLWMLAHAPLLQMLLAWPVAAWLARLRHGAALAAACACALVWAGPVVGGLGYDLGARRIEATARAWPAQACTPPVPLPRDGLQEIGNRLPFPWQRPPASQLAAWVSQLGFWMMLTLLATAMWTRLLRLLSGPAPAPRGTAGAGA
jgi:putative flippase GtrA